ATRRPTSNARGRARRGRSWSPRGQRSRTSRGVSSRATFHVFRGTQQQKSDCRDDDRLYEPDRPAAAVWADLAPDDVAEGRVEEVAGRPRDDPGTHRPEAPGAEREERPVDRRREHRERTSHLEAEPDLDVTRAGDEEISDDGDEQPHGADDGERGHPPGSRGGGGHRAGRSVPHRDRIAQWIGGPPSVPADPRLAAEGNHDRSAHRWWRDAAKSAGAPREKREGRVVEWPVEAEANAARAQRAGGQNGGLHPAKADLATGTEHGPIDRPSGDLHLQRVGAGANEPVPRR